MSDFPYSAAYSPPAPACELTLINERAGHRVTVTAILDTGADATIIPVRYLRELRAQRAIETGLRSQWGERRSVYLYLVDLQIADVLLPSLYVVGDELGQECILGRNALNRLRLLLDGPEALTRLLK